jgi:hypothetical protein
MKIQWKEANEGLPVPEEQYQERFWRRRLDGIGLDTANKEFLAIEFKRTQDARSNYVERATVVAQEQYTSLLTGLQAVGQVKEWKVQQIVFVGGSGGSVHVESFNKNMKVDGVMGGLIVIYKYIIIRISENYFKLRYFWLLYFQHTCDVCIH